MESKALRQTNPYLRDRKSAHSRLIRGIASSTAIETGESVRLIEKRLALKHFSRFRVTLA